MIRSWDKLPVSMQNESVKPYYEHLRKKRISLIVKRVFDIIASLLMLLLISPILLILAILVKIDSQGPVFYRQQRVTQYGRVFRIFKFRTMVRNADTIGSHVTVDKDPRITRLGARIRDIRFDELPQLLNVLIGDMTFVGVRPEATQYVDRYTDEMRATLLLPAGLTSHASIAYKDEAALLAGVKEDVDAVYLSKILPAKMQYNLKDLRNFSIKNDARILWETVLVVFRR